MALYVNAHLKEGAEETTPDDFMPFHEKQEDEGCGDFGAIANRFAKLGARVTHGKPRKSTD